MNITRAADASIQAVSPALSFGTGHLQGKKLQRCEQRNLRPVQGWVKQPMTDAGGGGKRLHWIQQVPPKLFATSDRPAARGFPAPTDPRREERRGRKRWALTVGVPRE